MWTSSGVPKVLRIQIRFRRRVKDEIKRLKDESTHNDMVEEARPGDAACVKAIWQEHMDLEKFFSKGAMENVYLQPEMLFTKMPRDPGNERANAMHNIHDQVRFLPICLSCIRARSGKCVPIGIVSPWPCQTTTS